ncbi:MAG: Asp-tRNA(Asn)/Glu-tRNA(Gln) amidotransferase subunit GatA [Christensenellaceae bacterium]|jgi:aspartyl-tRNA(Asn)/glutamyl-tRNA(Gln) amidotransferase subunit A|nr:Asp-tRNA(Asn)/Glu-tRNA(Gln) amidotransferase subunit GatA [Christensenellaceae bacterium]
MTTALEIGQRLQNGELCAEELLSESLSRVKALDKDLNSVVGLYEEQAFEQARAAQKRLDQKQPLSALDGVPTGLKDLLCALGQRSAAGSKMLGSFVSPYDASAVAKLRAAGAVMPLRLNMDEFAMGSTTETSFFGQTKNPWDLARVPGGSSGGSAAAVAAGLVPYALGSDTGGSIRQPASHCGVTGFKPSYGAVSRYGLIAYASSLDQIGPIAPSARDCAAVLDLISGADPHDATSSGLAAPTLPALGGDLKGLRIGLPEECFGDGVEHAVRERVLAVAEALKGLGASVERFRLGGLEYAVPTYYIIACAEASSNLSRFDGVKYGHRAANAPDLSSLYVNSRTEGFGPEVRKRILLGTFVLSSGYYDAYYLKAVKAQARIRQSYESAFARFDLILTPVAPSTAPRLGESLSDPLKMYLSDIFTVSVNLAGLPALSVPAGLDESRLPVGAQLIGRRFDDKTVLRAGDAFQRATSFHSLTPPIHGGARHAS